MAGDKKKQVDTPGKRTGKFSISRVVKTVITTNPGHKIDDVLAMTMPQVMLLLSDDKPEVIECGSYEEAKKLQASLRGGDWA